MTLPFMQGADPTLIQQQLQQQLSSSTQQVPETTPVDLGQSGPPIQIAPDQEAELVSILSQAIEYHQNASKPFL